jgi:hypothetical protein
MSTSTQTALAKPRFLGLLLALGAGIGAALLLGGCGGGGDSVTNSATAQANAIVHQLVRCIRTHGVPTFPDPIAGSDGVLRPPTDAPRVPPATVAACQSIADRLPPNYTSTQPVSTVDFQKLIRFARCIRSHGVPDWPDPNALGEFPLNRRLIVGGKRLVIHAVQACARLNPDPSGGINITQAP